MSLESTAIAAGAGTAAVIGVLTGADLAAIAVGVPTAIAALVTATSRLWATGGQTRIYVDQLREDNAELRRRLADEERRRDEEETANRDLERAAAFSRVRQTDLLIWGRSLRAEVVAATGKPPKTDDPVWVDDE